MSENCMFVYTARKLLLQKILLLKTVTFFFDSLKSNWFYLNIKKLNIYIFLIINIYKTIWTTL